MLGARYWKKPRMLNGNFLRRHIEPDQRQYGYQTRNRPTTGQYAWFVQKMQGGLRIQPQQVSQCRQKHQRCFPQQTQHGSHRRAFAQQAVKTE